jgi:membrane protein
VRFLVGLFVKISLLKRLFAEKEDIKKAAVEPPHAAPPPAPEPSQGPALPRDPQRSAQRDAPSEGAGNTPVDADASSVESPLAMEGSDWKSILKRTVKEIKDDRVTLIAAGMAYYIFLAIFPAFIALIGVLGLVNAPPETIESISDTIRTSLPAGSGEVLVGAIEEAKNPAEGTALVAALVGIGVALWSASSGFVALQSGLNVAYDIPHDRKFLGKRAVAFMLIVATGVLGAVPSPFFTFGEGLIFTIIGWVLTLAAVIALFSIYYAVGPKRDTPRWKWVTPGGVVGALIWILASLGFGYYASTLGNYSDTYGPVGLIVVLIFWLWLSSIAILVGGEMNAEMERQTQMPEGAGA